MKVALLLLSAILVAGVVVLLIWRQMDHRADSIAAEELIELSKPTGERFHLSMVAGLPEPARRYFAFSIEEGAPLCTAFEIKMDGELGNGTKDAPNYQLMKAIQTLAPPHGLIWKVKAGALSGSDGALPGGSWTRFWLLGFVPVVRASGADHHRSAFGRVIAEAAFWAPASLLPSDRVRWEEVDEDTARATISYGSFTQDVDITVDEEGAPVTVRIDRWSNENAAGEFREQPFGGNLSGHRRFGDYNLPTHVEGGNHFGTEHYFPFFKANVNQIAPVCSAD